MTEKVNMEAYSSNPSVREVEAEGSRGSTLENLRLAWKHEVLLQNTKIEIEQLNININRNFSRYLYCLLVVPSLTAKFRLCHLLGSLKIWMC